MARVGNVRTGTRDKDEERIENFIDTGLLANHQEPRKLVQILV